MNPILKIVIEGKEREMLITPFLFRVAEQKGISITVKNPDDLMEVLEAYQKVIYLGIHAFHERQKFDLPNLGECDVTLLDIEVWRSENPEAYGKVINDIILLLTGKTVKELAEKQEEEKKKKSPFWAIMTRLKRS